MGCWRGEREELARYVCVCAVEWLHRGSGERGRGESKELVLCVVCGYRGSGEGRWERGRGSLHFSFVGGLWLLCAVVCGCRGSCGEGNCAWICCGEACVVSGLVVPDY